VNITAKLSTNDKVLPLRTRYREESRHQIVHDSIHQRPGWTRTYLLEIDGVPVGFGTIAVAGPWKDKPTIYEFYVRPESVAHAFALFDAFLATCGARLFEVQTSDVLLTVMVHTFARIYETEKIVFRDAVTTCLPSQGTVLKARTPDDVVLSAMDRRQDGGEWQLELDGKIVATGGLLFHYNIPYVDVFMEVNEPFRRRGFGSYLVQELKREAYRFGAIPAARTSPTNTGSRFTLQKAGFAPFSTIILAELTAG
jgi:GNAT superfamily N-acetyltransferase